MTGRAVMTRRALQILVALVGSVALVAGVSSVLFGVYIVPGHGEVVPSVDSELRFYAVWYAAAGIVLLRAVPGVEEARTTIRVVAAAFFIAGCARLISIAVAGKPHGSLLVLMALELVLPVVMVPWQAAVQRSA
ncbi:MAG: DUF4345 domain-containing protein [Actinobacteria bacterium]|nr:DUF4345 domain-containing protein [Actinomycetota bacterium]